MLLNLFPSNSSSRKLMGWINWPVIQSNLSKGWAANHSHGLPCHCYAITPDWHREMCSSTVKCLLWTLPLYLWSLGLASDHHTTKEISTFGHKSQSGRNANRKWAIITFHNYNNGEQTSKIHSFGCQLILVIYHDLRKKASSCLWWCWFRHLWNMKKVDGYEHKFLFGWYYQLRNEIWCFEGF